MSTQTNKLGLVGIHTPKAGSVHSMWAGLFQNYRKFRYVSCDVNMACASMLPADPLQIGTEAGDIAPQDMFNPILYKAVSNDSMSNLLNRLYAGVGGSAGSSLSVTADNALDFGYNDSFDVDQFAMYYGLLAENDGWKKAMPQSGLSMRGLKPLTFSMLATQGQPNALSSVTGNARTPGYNDPATGAIDYPTTWASNRFMRGPTVRMPSMPTYCKTTESMDLDAVDTVQDVAGYSNYAGTLGQKWAVPAKSAVAPNLDVPQCFVAAIVLPPAKLNQLYYRMKVTWTVEFTEPRALTELTNFYGLAVAGVLSYGSDYINQSAIIAKTSTSSQNSMVDTSEVSATKIMDSVN